MNDNRRQPRGTDAKRPRRMVALGLLLLVLGLEVIGSGCILGHHDASNLTGVTIGPAPDDATAAPDTSMRYWLGLGADTSEVRERALAIANTASRLGADRAELEFRALTPRMRKAVASALMPIRTEVKQEEGSPRNTVLGTAATYRSVTWYVTGYARIGVIFRYYHTSAWTTDYSRIVSTNGPFNDGTGYNGWSYSGSRYRDTIGGGAGSTFWDNKTGGKFVLFANKYVNLGTATPWIESVCNADGSANAWGSS